MEKLEIIQNEHGMILINSTSKYVFYLSKKSNSKTANMYLKKVEPKEQYISGMFQSKNKKNTYIGKTITNNKVVLTLTSKLAYLNIS